MLSSRALPLLAAPGALVACTAAPFPISVDANHLASPTAAEASVLKASHVLDLSTAAAGIRPSPPGLANVAAYYTCVMHPKIHQDHPGNCPICGMTLVKKDVSQEGQKGAAK